jgi:3'(2'), 5'-bisphosphate nucleotidase
VHVALWTAEADDLVLGAVGLPDGVTLTSAAPPPAPRDHIDAPRVVASRTRAPAVVDDVVAALNGVKVPLGSAGAKIAAVVRGEAEAYVHAGGQWEWDSAAPVGVALAAGLHASRVDGSPLEYNRPHPYLPDLLVCRPELAADLLREIAAAG